MKKILFSLLIFSGFQLFAQVPEDAIKYSWYPQNGTARTLAIGGATGSLGGDISSLYGNPAGLGFFKTNEFVLSPAFSLNNNKADYREQKTNGVKKNSFGLGPIGVILGAGRELNNKFSTAFSIGFIQTANFNNNIKFKGLNNLSSFSEQFVEEFSYFSSEYGYTIDDMISDNSPLPFTVAPALDTYLIDTVRINGELKIRGASESILDGGEALMQEYNKRTSGGIYEPSLGVALNDDKHWLLGGSIGIPIISYNSETTIAEYDTSANENNGFKSASFKDEYNTSGAGLNLKIGAIYRPTEFIRIGLAVHTPSYMLMTDERATLIKTSLENPQEDFLEPNPEEPDKYLGSRSARAKYTQFSPWRVMLSGSYVFREIVDVTKQKGFITADVEYVNHRGSRFGRDNSEESEDPEGDKEYYKQLNNVVKEYYKGAFNFRVGAELKFNIIMARLGFAYYGNPYKDAELKARQMLLSGGLGYRHKGMFFDLSYVHNISKDTQFPYRLQDRPNTFASLKNTRGNIAATLGFKF